MLLLEWIFDFLFSNFINDLILHFNRKYIQFSFVSHFEQITYRSYQRMLFFEITKKRKFLGCHQGICFFMCCCIYKKFYILQWHFLLARRYGMLNTSASKARLVLLRWRSMYWFMIQTKRKLHYSAFQKLP